MADTKEKPQRITEVEGSGLQREEFGAGRRQEGRRETEERRCQGRGGFKRREESGKEAACRGGGIRI